MISVREFVGHLSPGKREIIAAPARLLPPKFRYGPAYEKTEKEIFKARTVPSWAQREIDSRLEQAMAMASKAPYYSENQDYAVLSRVADGSVQPREALAQLPVLTRADVSEHYRDMLAVPETRVEVAGSSGSSGEPILFYLDRNRGAREWAFIVNTWSATGYRLGDWRAVFRGIELPNGRPHFAMPSVGEFQVRTQSISAESIGFLWGEIARRKIRYLHGYASALSLVAKFSEDSSEDTSWRFRIRGIFPASEQFTREQAETLRRVFPHAGIAPFYGLSEKTVCARMDDDHVYHSYPTYGYVELVHPDGTLVKEGERGRIVTTTLDGRGQPLLRYDTGDSAEFVGVANNGSVAFKDILSRRGREGLVRSDGRLFPTTSLRGQGEEFSCVYRFRFRQEVPGRAVLVVQPSPTATNRSLRNFYDHMVRRTQNQVELELEVVRELPATVNGKSTLLEQHIPDAPTTWA